MSRKPKVAIIGGGIAGLAAALALHRRGIEFDLYEQAARFPRSAPGFR
jgi:carotenoid phi-ring synthase / carotenoid chi-ring synthase